MKILKANAGILTNFEVLDFLRSRGASKDASIRVMSSVLDSEFKVFDYLVEGAACNQTRESINEFVEKSKEYQFAKAEIVNIINIRPTSEVELAPMIEDWEARMEDKMEELLEMILQVLPPPPNSDQEAVVNDSAEGAEGEQEDNNATEEDSAKAEDNSPTKEDNINVEEQMDTEEG